MSRVDHAKRGRHTEFDHSIYPDKRTLNVGGREFVISGTYLAVRSEYFRRLFYGSDANRAKNSFTIDADGDIFEDLIDIVYPYSKSTTCCVDCSGKLIERLELAVRLELDGAVEKLLLRVRDDEVLKTLERIGGLKFASFIFRDFQDLRFFKSSYDHLSAALEIRAADYFGERRMEHAALRNYSRVLHSVERFYPDSRIVLVSGKEYTVSATTLSMHSTWIKEHFFGSQAGDLEIAAMDDVPTFEAFVLAAYGKILTSDEMTVELLNVCSVIDAPSLYDDLVKTVGKNTSWSEASKLLRHAAFAGKMEKNYIIRHAMNMPESELTKLFSQLDQDSQIMIKLALDSAVRDKISITIKAPNGRKSELGVFVHFSVGDLKEILQEAHGIPPDQQRLYYAGKQLQDDRTLGDYGISDKSMVHVVLRLTGC